MITLAPSDDDVFDALRQTLNLMWQGNMPVVQGQQNLVGEPKGQNYVVMTPLYRRRLKTNQVTQIAAARAVMQAVEFVAQCDVHGPNAADNAQIISTLMRDDWACQAFEAIGYAVSPLFTDDPRQTPFVNGEGQYEGRWSVDVHLQANCTVSTTQQFADTLTAVLVEVDATYPPGG